MSTKQVTDDFYATVKKLLDNPSVNKPRSASRGPARPGRPTKIKVPVQPVLLHLYRDQVRWLDDYAEFLTRLAPDNVHLSRVEIVRALLLALGEYALKYRMTFPDPCPITSEQDLQRGIVQALEATQAVRPRSRKT